MGLSERRAAKAFQDGPFQELQAKINEAACKELEIEVDWNSLAIDGMSHMYEEAFPKVYFLPLIGALQAVCIDDMGKEALAEGLEKVTIQNQQGISSASRWATFQNKALVLDHKPITNIDYVKDRTDSLQKLLEDGL
ncbi:MAG: hypothetical protein KC800_17340 [Candidatus Eremiobacteraeota bacterium]|nr:hypothetical protein [Candidatus Eremiobacteraeota bacterium]